MATAASTAAAWHLDVVFVTLRGEPHLLWRTVDEHGAELDILLQKRRDKAAASQGRHPRPGEGQTCVRRGCGPVNNRAENSHQPTRERERRMCGFRDPKRTQAFLSSFGLIRQHFALKRHLLRASF